MRKFKCLLIGAAFLFLSQYAYAAEPPAVTAEAVIVMDAENARVICARNAFEARPPASLTKVLTAIVALDMANLQEICTVSPNAAATIESHVGLKAGERIYLEEVLYGVLLRSGNDACVAIAEHIGESETHFAQMMNLKADILGCVNTNFVNSNGLPEEKHYSCAYDLALMTRYALTNEKFREIVSREEYTMHWIGGRTKNIRNTNRLLYVYDGAIGVKTGTTNEAGQCLIAAAEREGRCYIAVVLKSKDRFTDCSKLLDYAFSLKEKE